jgi:hypothetical protein
MTVYSAIGTVERKIVNPGSKSEHEAAVLRCGTGAAFALRLRGANPFEDKSFDKFVGQRVLISGALVGGTLIVQDLSAVRPMPKSGPKPAA